MKNKRIVILIAILVILLGISTAMVIYLGAMKQRGQGPAPKVDGVQTFANWTEEEVFQTIPAMIVDNAKIGKVQNYGGDVFQIDVSGTELEDYKAYLKMLKECGFKKHVDNGAEGLDGAIYSTTFTKDNLMVTVIQAVKINKTYITVGKDVALSPNLFYDDSYVKDNIEGAKTTLHMVELYDNGSSFIIQLKNGHFIMNDGGLANDLPYLLDYLESLVPEGEKPIIDAWFISHAHGDHVGWLDKLVSKMEYIDRVCVESVYFSESSESSAATVNATGLIRKFMSSYKMLRTTEGKAPTLYRPQAGQRYYFNDLTVDIVFTQEQLATADMAGDYNDASTWLMYNIENQKFLLAGDAADASSKTVMEIYDKDYFNLDLYCVFHHGINVYNYFTDYIQANTILYTSYRCGSMYSTGSHSHPEENDYLMSIAKEILAFGDGTKVLTFPYKIGTAATMPKKEWIYDNNEQIYGVWGPRLEKYETHIINE